MSTEYFKTAWRDITRSPRWVTKIVLLSLVSFIPVFGWIVVGGYLLCWARDIAWHAQTPLPERIFDNSDGMLYRRGLFSLVIAIVCALAPYAVLVVGGMVSAGSGAGAGLFFGGVGLRGVFPLEALSSVWVLATVLAFLAAGLFATVFGFVGVMRMSVYGRLSAGFQLGKSWAMIRHDAKGMAKIVGMSIIVGAVGGAIVCAFAVALGFACMGVVIGLYEVGFFAESTMSILVLVGGGMALVFVYLACMLVLQFVSVFCGALVVRALGYWTSQFEVARWRGQDDPMPFEKAS